MNGSTSGSVTERWVGSLRAYLGILRAQLRTVSHFRANLLAWVLYSPLQLGIVYLLWAIVYRSTDEVGGFGFDDMILYYLLVHLLRRIFGPLLWINVEVWREINEGKLDIYLARPIRFGPFLFCRSLAAPLMEIALGVPFFLVFLTVLGLPMQKDPSLWVAFLASAAAGYVVLFFVQFLIGLLTFWMERIFGIRDIVFSVFMLFSGQLIPISVLPTWATRVSALLPFESIYYIPARIFAMPQAGPEVALLLLRQVLWIGALWALATVVWTRGVRRYASQGG